MPFASFHRVDLKIEVFKAEVQNCHGYGLVSARIALLAPITRIVKDFNHEKKKLSRRADEVL